MEFARELGVIVGDELFVFVWEIFDSDRSAKKIAEKNLV